MLLSRKSGSLLAGVAVSALALSGVARADSFTVVNGQTVNSTQILNTPGDVGTVEQGGTINAVADDGINASTDGVRVDNAGSVTGLGDGMEVQSNSTVNNSGTSTGSTSYGIKSADHNTITNSGTSTGGFGGLFAFDHNTIANSGMATGLTYGIGVRDNNTIINTGTSTGGLYGIGGYNFNTIANPGTAIGGQYGIIAANSNNTISNSGGRAARLQSELVVLTTPSLFWRVAKSRATSH